MERDEPVRVVQQTGLRHRVAAAHALFRRLKEKTDLAFEGVFVFGDVFGHRQADRGVPVVTAGVHPALVDGAETFPGGKVPFVRGFVGIHAIDVEAHGDDGAVASRV